LGIIHTAITEAGITEKDKVTYRESMRLQQAVPLGHDRRSQSERICRRKRWKLVGLQADGGSPEVELEHRKGKEKLEIELSWKLEGSVKEAERWREERRENNMPRWIWGIIGVILVIVAIILILRLV
jgi:hypothetical protein